MLTTILQHKALPCLSGRLRSNPSFSLAKYRANRLAIDVTTSAVPH